MYSNFITINKINRCDCLRQDFCMCNDDIKKNDDLCQKQCVIKIKRLSPKR